MRSSLKNILSWVAFGLLAIVVGTSLIIYLGLPEVTDLKTKNPETTALMRQRYRAAQNAKKEFVFRHQWVTFEKIPQLLKDAVRITEDAGFYQHKGVDFTELKIALKKNWEKGKFVRGASTITQQLAKNLYLSTDKSVIRKIKEYLIARRLETHLKKNRIFSLYLNVIEFGPGLFGVQAASQYYFNKDVSRLLGCARSISDNHYSGIGRNNPESQDDGYGQLVRYLFSHAPASPGAFFV